MRNASPLPLVPFDMLVEIFDRYDGSIDHCADCDRDSTQRHDVRCETKRPHREESDQDPNRQRKNRNEGTREMQQEYDCDDRHDDRFLYEFLAKRRDGVVNETRAIVPLDESDSAGECRLYLFHPFFYSVDDSQRVFSIAYDNPTRDHLTSA